MPYHLFSSSGPRKVQYPIGNFLALSDTLDAFSSHIIALFFAVQTMHVVVHRHEYDAVLEVLRVDLEPILHQLLDLLEKLRCRRPWENLPLEHERFSSDVVQFSVFWS